MTEDGPASEVITTDGQIEIEIVDGAPMVNQVGEEKHQHVKIAVEEVITMRQLHQFTLIHHHHHSNIDNIPIQTHQIQQPPITLPTYPINKLLINKLQTQKYN